MPPERPHQHPRSAGFGLPQWLVIVLFLLVTGISWWKNSQTAPQTSHREQNPPSWRGHESRETSTEDTHESTQQNQESTATEYQIAHQTIRDLNGHIAYEGTIDLKPTIDRIRRGESDRHRHDGTEFQNREGRLPRKPRGYYKEYVHPTPGEHGPGPQRIIMGQDGDIWYTPDHYRSFIEVK